MSIDAYSVAVKISLVENVTRGLMMMGRHFATTDAQAKVLEDRLKSIGKQLAVGGAFAMAGAFGLGLFKKPIEEAMEYERRLGSLRQMGLGDAQIADARKFVQATNIIGESMNDRMRLFVDAQGSFRQSGMSGGAALEAAKSMMPIMGTYEAATKMLTGEKRANAEMGMRSLNKIVEIMGGLTDTNRAKAIADGVFKASQSSGGMVDERQLKQFVAYGSSATNQLQLRTIFGGLEPLIGELGGSTSAVGLRTAYTRTNGMMSLPPKRLVEEMGRLGMLKAGTNQQSDDLARLQATDVIGYAQKMVSLYASHGITNRTDIERENAIVFGTNGSKIYNKIMSQMPVIQESLKAYDRSQGAGGVVNDPSNRTLKAQMDLEAKEATLKLQIGQIILPMYVKMLEKTRDVLASISNFATNHPTMFKMLIEGFAGLSALALVGGGLTMFTAGIRGLSIALPMVGGAMRVLVPAFQILGGALRYLPGLFRVLVGVMGTVGLVVTGIAVIGWLVYNNWKEIKASLIASWADIKDGVIKLFHGDIIGALSSFSVVFVRGWQTVFNTLIAGINAILPSAMQIGKFTFGDDFAAKYGADRTVRPGAANGGGQGHIYMDGKKVGTIVSGHMNRAASRPNTGGGSFDGSRSMASTLSLGF